MTDCEYIKLCEKAFGATVPGCSDDHWRGCPNYDLCVLVHNNAIEKTKEKINELYGHHLRTYLEGLTALKKPASQEGE